MLTPSQVSLQHQLDRLERQIARLEELNRHMSWGRLALFLIGITLTWQAARFFGAALGWATSAFALLVFISVAILQRRLEGRIKKFQAWHALQSEQMARLKLDWAHIPSPVALVASSSLALDLDLTGSRSLHTLIDRAISVQGSACLAGWLTAAVPDLAQITARQSVVCELKVLPRFCKRLLLTARLLTSQPLDDVNVLGWLETPLPESALRRVLPWVTLLAVVDLTLFILNLLGILPPYWLVSLLVYAILYFACQGMIGKFLAALFRLDHGLETLQPLLHYIESYPYGQFGHLEQLCAPFLQTGTRPSRLLRQVKGVTAAAGMRMNPAMGVLLNLLVPWDYWVAWLAAFQKKRLASRLPDWMDTFHELEALISLGMFAEQNPAYAFPQITSLRTSSSYSKGSSVSLERSVRSAHVEGMPPAIFAAQQMGHPMIPAARRVCNDFVCHSLGELNLVTGSNMAGKSTFIRTVGVNLCLAYAGGPVCAAVLQSIPFRLYTCIRLSDSLLDDFSYFYAEVKRLKGLLEAAYPVASEYPLLYLIDEIFRGTNNRERLIGSRAFIKALVETPTLGFLATHDLELARLAEAHPQIHNFHFRDEVIGGKLAFDYHIRPGASPTTNALKIMQLEGLPVDDK